MQPDYVELGVMTNFSFLRGASHGDELVATARALGLAGIGVADRNSLAGVVRAHVAARQQGLALIVGARLVLREGTELLCFPEDRAAYGRLAALLTLGKRRTVKGQCDLTLTDVMAAAEGQLFVLLPPSRPDAAFAALAEELARAWRGRVWLALAQRLDGGDRRRLTALATLGRAAGLPLLAHNDVMMHGPGRRALADVLTCIREGVSVDEAGWRLAANAERHLKSPAEMARLFADHPEALAATLEVAARARFSLDSLCHEYPSEVAPGGDPQAALAEATWAGAAERYPGGIPSKVRQLVARELQLIAELDYARFFLTVHDVVRFARSQSILCQGRGSAANSAVCYCLGVTSVDPARIDLLFERFVSAARREPPDIDVDFEHERREEVIQYIYEKYGRHRAGLAATVIRYRARGALRDVGKALGLSADTIETLSGSIWGWSREGVGEEILREAGLDPAAPRLRLLVELTGQIAGFPRHLSQHVGGFVITESPLSEVVPIENAAMEGRSVIEWDKDDLDALGLIKVDVLALGMLTCIRKAFDLIARHCGRRYDLASLPAEDPAVYEMLSRADSLGVFQVESRAQMSMLPRLRPATFYDLVIQVAIVRPGPIQGDMVHPYLRRRQGKEPVRYPSKALEAVLGKTLGVPLFQEQAMKIAIVAAGFSPEEADRLRRAMATFRNVGTIHTFRQKFIGGMVERGYEEDFAERCFRQIEGFGTYGFPESHACSFALLVYVSAWIKCHYPAVFATALLNSQPLGFYAPAQILRDARDHGVSVLPLGVNESDWDQDLEPHEADPKAQPPDRVARLQRVPRQDAGLAVRLGFRQAKGLKQPELDRLIARRGNGYADPLQLWRRAEVSAATLEGLAKADAFQTLGLSRREALWAVKGLAPAPLPLFAAAGEEERGPEPHVVLPDLSEGEQVVEDYRWLSLTLRAHPVSFLRQRLAGEGLVPAEALERLPDGRRIALAGLVLVRQRPGSAKGVIFATLEDETGVANVIVWPKVFERYRRIVLQASLLKVAGRLQKEGEVIHLVADRLVDLSERLESLEAKARDILVPDIGGPARSKPARATSKSLETALAPADEVRRPQSDQRGPPRGRPPALQRSRDFH
ncbi:MAG: error-prone DNA polymerase [Rhodospirillales bacterium]